MNKLSVPLAAVTESGAFIDTTVSSAAFRPEDAEDLPVSSVTVRGTLCEAGQEYVFTGTVSGVYERPCDRCLDAVTIPLDIKVAWSFRQCPAVENTRHMDDEESEAAQGCSYAFEGNEINMAPQVWEELVLAAPAKFLCAPDCAGLCVNCGANLNRDACTCRENVNMDNKGLKGLADLFSKSRPKNPKE